jgi:two-component system, cell cycle response regulator DivK
MEYYGREARRCRWLLMPGETILVVEDSPVSLKLVAAVLREAGYKVQIASTAEQAWSTLRFKKPELVLVDLSLPGMSGLELTSKIKQDVRLGDITVVALTACVMEGDEEEARIAGCDGYLTKPIDGPTLTMRVREYLEHHVDAPPPPCGETSLPLFDQPIPQALSFGLPESELEDLRRSFLDQGAIQSHQLLTDVGTQFDAPSASRIIHQWAGSGGLLGFPRISELAREVEIVLGVPDPSVARVREALSNLAGAFGEHRALTAEATVPEAIAQELQGKRVGLVGLANWEAERVCAALERANAKPRLFAADDPLELESILACNIVMVHVRPETMNCQWLAPGFIVPPVLPLVFIGARELLLSLDAAVQVRAREFLIDGWQPEEALMRLSFALSRPSIAIPFTFAGAPAMGGTGGVVAVPGFASHRCPNDLRAETVVIADDDQTIRKVVQSALQKHGWRCHLATDGPEALQMIRDRRPHAAVIDVNMPGMDGFEVLAAVRAEGIAVRIILLTARQQEHDILRGFSLGSDDYVVKPFNPMELVARLKRLLAA